MSAANGGFLNIVNLLFKKKADLLRISSLGYTALYLACENGHVATVEFLLNQKGIEKIIDQPEEDGFTPLMISTQKGFLNIVELLLNANSNLTWVNTHNGGTALYIACQEGHVNIVELFLTKNGIKKIINLPLEDGSTSLMVAAQNGFLPIVKMLVYKGANVNAVAKNGIDALSIARQRGHTDIVTFLESIQNNVRQSDPLVFSYNQVASQSIQPSTQLNPIVNPQQSNQNSYSPEVISVLSQCKIAKDGDKLPTPELALRRAAAANKINCIKILLKINNIDINGAGSESKKTALHIAIENDNVEIAQLLIAAQAKILPDKQQKTPEDYAKESKNDQIRSLFKTSEKLKV